MNHVPVPQKLRDHVNGSDASVSLKDIQLIANCTPSYYLMYSTVFATYPHIHRRHLR